MTRSLSPDVNDRRMLQRLRSEAQGTASAEEGEKTNAVADFFFNQHGAPLPIEQMYTDSSAFLIAAGPSFKEVPKEPLRQSWSMVLNNASASFRGNANCTVDDPSRFSLSVWLDPCITKFVPMGHLERPLWDNRHVKEGTHWIQKWEPAKVRLRDCPNVIGYCRNERFDAARWLYEDTFNWGDHARYGGARSVMLPALRILFLLGFRRVYLLGVDFEMSAANKYHFPEDRSARAISNNARTYARLQQRFSQLQPLFLRENFIVKNCNPKSRLKAFPFMPFDEAAQEAASRVGDHARERTEGMYRGREDKLLETGNASRLEKPMEEGASEDLEASSHEQPASEGAKP